MSGFVMSGWGSGVAGVILYIIGQILGGMLKGIVGGFRALLRSLG